MIQELLEFKNVDTNFIKWFLEKDIAESIKNKNYDFDMIFFHLLTDKYSKFTSIDFLYRILINTQELNENASNIVKNALYNRIKMKKTITAFSEAVKDIVNTSQDNDDENCHINLVCIETEAYAKPNGIPFPFNIKTPTIYEKA